MRGGTAINLFWRNLPRLSVDLDLTYLPVADRAASLEAIDTGLRRLGHTVVAAMPRAVVDPQPRDLGQARRLIVRADGAQVRSR